MTNAKKLSPAQSRLAASLANLPAGDTLFPPSGLSASAWWRTAQSLVRMGIAVTNGYVVSPGPRLSEVSRG